MEKCLISVGLDCLLSENRKLSFFTKLVLKDIIRNGHYLILYSKESVDTIYPYLKKLHLFNYPVICFNGGALLYINSKQQITKADYFKIENKAINNFIYQNKEIILNIDIQTLDKEESKKNLQIDKQTIKENIIYSLITINKKNQIQFEKNLKKFSNLKIQFLEEKGSFFIYQIISHNTGILECILSLQKKYKIKDQNIICFGKNAFSLDLLKHFPNSYLMKDTINEKSIKKTIKDSSHNGVIDTLVKNHKNLF